MRLSDEFGKEAFESLKQALNEVRPWHKRGALHDPQRIMTWKDINELVSTQDMFGRELVLAKSRGAVNPLQPTHYLGRKAADLHITVGHPNNFAKYIREGFSVVLNGTQHWHSSIAKLCTNLGRDLMSDVRANVYGSWGKESPFGTHWDEHDVLVLQLDGEKHWTAYGGGDDFPTNHALHRKGHPPPADPALQVTLKPGDALYLPRGCWHDVRTGNAPSLHITVGIRRFTALDVFDWLKSEAEAHVDFRKNIPTLASDGEIDSFIANLVQQATSLGRQDGAESLLRFLQTKVTGRPFISLPFLGGQFSAERAANARFRLERWVRKAGTILTDQVQSVLTDGTKRWAVPESVGDVLPLWSTGISFTLQDIISAGARAGVDEDTALRILSDLLDEGVAFLESDTRDTALGIDEAPSMSSSRREVMNVQG